MLLFAHGAGAPSNSPFMDAIVGALEQRAVAVRRFEFDYMATRRRDGKRRPPPPVDKLAVEFTEAARTIFRETGQHVVVGGKSMGGRVASMIADRLFAEGIATGCVAVGYPFHPAGKPGTLRTAHLVGLTCPMLIVQGERDPLGSRPEVERYDLSKTIEVLWLADGDHDLAPRRASGSTKAGHIETAAEATAAFIRNAGSNAA